MLHFDLPIWLYNLSGAVWTLLALAFGLFGCNSFWMVLRTLRMRESGKFLPQSKTLPLPDSWPQVTVQLPFYNELAVAVRIIDACAVLDYPPNKLEIQVLDDSSDETQYLSRARVQYWRSQGINIRYLHRNQRVGYKAGALQWGLEQAQGDLLAIFDADFQPEPEFLKQTVGYLSRPENSNIGFLQTRWYVVNTGDSLVAKSLSLAIDGHFAVEVLARSKSGLWFGFNGSAGVWRKACIVDPQVGGWSGSTLCEDLHLSYLAQLAGWNGEYLENVTVKSDAPIRLAELRLQQFRWAKGSVQVLSQLLAPLLRAQKIGWGCRLQAILHLSSYLQQPILLCLIILALPLTLLHIEPPVWANFVMIAGLGPVAVIGFGQWRLYPKNWGPSIPTLATLSLVGIGFCLANAFAVSEALRGKVSPFQRTPKGTNCVHAKSRYLQDTRPLEDRVLPWEWLLTSYCLLTLIISLDHPIAGVWPVSLVGLCSIGLLAIWSHWDRQLHKSFLGTQERSMDSTETKQVPS